MLKLFTDIVGAHSIVGIIAKHIRGQDGDFSGENFPEEVAISYQEKASGSLGLSEQAREAEEALGTEIRLLDLQETTQELEGSTLFLVKGPTEGKKILPLYWNGSFIGQRDAADIQELWAKAPNRSRAELGSDAQNLKRELEVAEDELDLARAERDSKSKAISALEEEKNRLLRNGRAAHGRLMKAVGTAYGSKSFRQVAKSTGLEMPLVLTRRKETNKIDAIRTLRDATKPVQKLGLKQAKEMHESIPGPEDEAADEENGIAVFNTDALGHLEEHFVVRDTAITAP
jgi:ribosomal protein L7/L12